MKESEFLENFAKILGASDKLREIEEKRQKEKRMLESLGAQFGVVVEHEAEREVPAAFVEQVVIEPMPEQEQQEIIPVVEPVVEPIVENVIPPLPQLPVNTIVTKSVEMISKVADTQSAVDKIDDPIRRELDAMKKTIADLHRYARNTSQMGGGGEVNLRWLDDVDRNSIADHRYLRYDESMKKFTFDTGHDYNFYGAFQSTATQTCNPSTATALTYNQTDFSYGITIANSSHVVIQHPGLYNAQFSVQLINSGTQIDSVYIWLRQNGVDVAGSTGKIDVPSSHGGNPGALLIGWNFYIKTISSSEYFEFMWFTPEEVHVTIPTLPEQTAVGGVSPYIPGTASVVLTVSPVSVSGL